MDVDVDIKSYWNQIKDEEDQRSIVMNNGSSMTKAGFAGVHAPHAGMSGFPNSIMPFLS